MTRRSVLFGAAAMALRNDRVERAIHLIEQQVESGQLRAATLHVRQGDEIVSRSFGAAKTPNAVYLLASITKPMTASAVMLLSDRKALALDDAVHKFLPEFTGGDRQRVTIRHLLTHTSGLPDMLPDSEELRKRHAPLKDFVAGTCTTPLLFTPGTQVKYQSMGILLAAEIVERVTRRLLPEFLREEVFVPLGMKDTSLGLGGRKIEETMQCEVGPPTDWDWNSSYWRNLASPWGGAHSTAADVDRFLQYFGHPSNRLLQPATAAAMITNQTEKLHGHRGIGWVVAAGGKRSSPRAFGHGGSTGTLAWFDPQVDTSLVLLTTKPAEVSQKSLLTPVSDLVSEAAAE